MPRQAPGAFVVAVALVLASVGAAGTARADNVSSGAEKTWEMPDLKGVVLQRAIDEVRAAAGDPTFPVDAVDYAHGQNVFNLTNWKVCDQSPKAGREVTPKTKKVSVFVNRLNANSCYG